MALLLAWSYSARKQGRNANDWREARAFGDRIGAQRPRAHAYQHRMEELWLS